MRWINTYSIFINENASDKRDMVLNDMISRIDSVKLNEYVIDNDYQDLDIHEASIFFLNDVYQIKVDENGIVEFDTLDDDIIDIVGDNYVKLYHFTSTKFKKSILENGLVSGLKKTNPYGNSYSGIYLTTRTSGREIEGYKYHIVNKHKGGVLLVTIKAKLDDIVPDMDDIDIASGKTQFVIDEVSPRDIISIEKVFY